MQMCKSRVFNNWKRNEHRIVTIGQRFVHVKYGIILVGFFLGLDCATLFLMKPFVPFS